MKVLVNSYPKSGTNLVEKLVRTLGIEQEKKTIALSSVLGRHQLIKQIIRSNSFMDFTIPIGLEVPVGVNSKWLKKYVEGVVNNRYFTGHSAYNDYLDYLLKVNNIQVLQVIRDPRAILSSMSSYVVEDINSWYPFHHFFKKMKQKDLIKFLILGGYVEEVGIYYSGIRESLKRMEGWLESENAVVIKFEDIVGSKGGGDDNLQKKELEKIFSFLKIDNASIPSIQNNLFGGTHTFRGGQIDSWKKTFDAELNDLIIHELGGLGLLEKLDYNDFRK